MKKVLKRIWNVLEIVILVYVVLTTVLFLNKNKYGFTEIGNRVLVCVDDTIEKNVDNVNKNDLLIIKKDNGNYDGSIYYYTVYKDKYLVKYTDLNNEILNGKNIINDNRVIGKSAITIPLLGGYLNFIHTKMGFILLVFMPVFLVFIYQVYRFIVETKDVKKEEIKKNLVDEEII